MRIQNRNENRKALPHHPLAITVTEAGRESVFLRALVRQAIPMLKSPEAYSPARRRELAQTLEQALFCTGESDTDADEGLPPFRDQDVPPEELEYEPGCCLEDNIPWE